MKRNYNTEESIRKEINYRLIEFPDCCALCDHKIYHVTINGEVCSLMSAQLNRPVLIVADRIMVCDFFQRKTTQGQKKVTYAINKVELLNSDGFVEKEGYYIVSAEDDGKMTTVTYAKK